MTRTKKTYETTDYAAMMRRLMKAHGKRVADGDVEDLAELMELQTYLDYIVRGAVTAQREDQGKSWADIARAAGTSRQAAQKKYS
jgi:hypothetical protein